ncbi:MAG: Unknown protein [uncultured Sulfurovum sp.]|uniref:Thioredoxin family protein n=1 Tax=uncultured Sulfurovum sp. TaxID=269237 RepID=A0A6S6UEY6_9BACT|nr:MAG: Unknown protein [uncultured Sulfurovum sp.]
MKVILLILLLLNFTACETKKTTYERNAGHGIPWEKNLDAAFTKAKEEKKTLLVMAVSDNCQWCDKMKARTLSDPKVAKKLEKYVLVMADRETPSERDQLHPFTNVPVIFFMTHEKDTIDELQGYYDPEDFLEYLVDFEAG